MSVTIFNALASASAPVNSGCCTMQNCLHTCMSTRLDKSNVAAPILHVPRSATGRGVFVEFPFARVSSTHWARLSMAPCPAMLMSSTCLAGGRLGLV
eukprot:2562780-Pyramimonas_sp.AAC.1